MKKLALQILVSFVALTSLQTLFAGTYPITSVIKTNHSGAPVVVGTSSASCTTSVFTSVGTHWDRRVTNRIGMEVDLNYPQYFGTNQTTKVRLSAVKYDKFNAVVGDTVIFLTVENNVDLSANPINQQYCQFFGSYRIDLKIDSIYVNGVSTNTLPANLIISNRIILERYFDYSSYDNTDYGMQVTELETDCEINTNAINISWNSNPQIVEYQLEWLHINDYGFDPTNPNNPSPSPKSPQNLHFDFDKNATRVSTTSTSYELNLVFDRGWLVFRVRGVGYNHGNENEEIFGAWSLPSIGIVNNVLSNQKYRISGGAVHENKLNWQYAATYAEEGKRKEVVSYFDGSLRNRQSVTKINSDDNTIVGETIYDHQGRAAIQVLPVPVPADTCANFDSKRLKFYPNFSLNENGSAAYDRSNFDLDFEGCGVLAEPMSTQSGASQYYSTNNPDKNGAQGYVPDAFRFPFTQTEYTPDNTGRIRRQGGVGADFQIGTGHETRYYYGQPEQIILDRLFGNEVGYSNHYKENVVVDANGQVSISYLDQEERVIATALSDENPSNLKELESAVDAAVELTENAFGQENMNNQISGDVIHFYKELLVKNTSTYTFQYDFSISPLQDECLPNYCIDCVYDLEMKLTDECGVNLFPEDINRKMKGVFTYDSESETYSFHTICETNEEFDFSKNITIPLSVGSYSLSKTLTVNNEARNQYIELYLQQASKECLISYEQFLAEEMSQIDTSGCDLGCEACREQLGTLEEFITSGEGTANDYYHEMQLCDKICNEIEQISLCDVTRSVMEMDMSPGGQYGEYLNPFNNSIDFSTYPLSVYNPQHQLPTSTSNPWRHPSYEKDGYLTEVYMDDNGDTSKIWLNQMVGGTWQPEPLNTSDVKWDPFLQKFYVLPHQLANVEDFITGFQGSWSKSLLKYHPEKCYLDACYGLEYKPEGHAITSEEFDAYLMKTNTFQEAIESGFLSQDLQFIYNSNLPTPSEPEIFENLFAPSNNNPSNLDHKWDPFVFLNYLGDQNCSVAATDLINRCQNYAEVNGSWISIANYAAYMARCSTQMPSQPDASCFNFGGPYNGSTYNIEILDREWQNLRSLYLAEKNKIKQKLQDCYALQNCNISTSCIGVSDYVASSYLSSPQLTDPRNPCGETMEGYYSTKDRRFFSESDINGTGPLSEYTAFNNYQLTGQCPEVQAFNALLNKLASSGKLLDNGVVLNDFPEWTNLMIAVNHPSLPYDLPTFTHNSTISVSGDVLTLTWLEGANTILTVNMTKSGNMSWLDGERFINFQVNYDTPNLFTTKMVKYNAFNVIEEESTISGSLIGNTFRNCADYLFPSDCNSNRMADELVNTLNYLIRSGKNSSEEAVNLNRYVDTLTNDTTYIATPLLKHLLNTDANQDIYFKHLNEEGSIIFDSINGAENGLMFLERIRYLPKNSSGKVAAIRNLSVRSNNGSVFHLNAVDSTGNLSLVLTIQAVKLVNGVPQEPVSMGDCETPLPISCQTTEHQAFIDFKRLVENLVENKTELNNDPHLTQVLLNQMPFGVTIQNGSYDPQTDVATVSYEGCNITFTVPGPNIIPDAVKVLDMEVVGDAAPIGLYNQVRFYTQFILPDKSIVYDYIYANTCFRMRPCEECVQQPLSAAQVVDLRAARLNNGSYFLDSTVYEVENDSLYVEKYAQYNAIVDSLNLVFVANNWDTISRLSFQDFVDHGFYEQLDNYIRYAQNHELENTLSKLIDFQGFVIKYGFATNVIEEYWFYYKSVDVYNYSRDTSIQVEISPISIKNFVDAKIADFGDEYSVYLNGLDTTTPRPLDILTYFNADTLDSTASGQLYKSYTDSYLAFFEFQDTLIDSLRCFDSFSDIPMLSYQDFLTRNVFCPSNGSSSFVNYVNSFSDSLNCPSDFPKYASCDSLAPEFDTQVLQRLYMQIRRMTDDYNASERAAMLNHQLNYPSFNFVDFKIKFKLPDCLRSYLRYLAKYTYTNSIDYGIPALSLSDFCPPNDPTPDPEPEDVIYWDGKDCKEAYKFYRTINRIFNQWATATNFPYLVREIATYGGFVDNNGCNCVDQYVANLINIVNGVVDFSDKTENEFYQFIELSQLCNKPCPPTGFNPLDISVQTSEEVTFVNPCVEMAINQATLNAQQRYAEYINGLRTDLYQRYTNHCLKVNEHLTYTFTNKAYHYTLYYYDQAGNLIKTIPPAGVTQLAILSSDDALAEKIRLDRKNKTKTVFTQHRLATTYMYNSLNQLVSQKTPDTDAMNLFELEFASGLPREFVSNRVQMIDEKTGYLAGVLNNRGYLYRTSNGGKSWEKMKGLVATDFNKIEMLDASVGFAVGSKGTVMKTLDGGNTWDWVSLLQLNWTGQLPDIHDIDIRGGSNPIVTLVGNQNFVVQSTDLQHFNLFNEGLDIFEDFNFDLYAIDHDNDGYKMVFNTPFISGILERAYTDNQWNLNFGIKGEEIKLLRRYWDELNAFIGFGENGRVQLIGKEPLTKLLASSLTQEIKDVQFFNQQQAIAIQNDRLLRTLDEGRTWTNIDPLNTYQALSKSKDESSILAVGDARRITLFVPSNGTNAARVEIPFNGPNANFTKCWHSRTGNTNRAVLAAGNQVYFSWNIATANPTWVTNTAPLASAVKSMELVNDGNSIKGLLLTHDGNLHKVVIQGSNFSVSSFVSDVSRISGDLNSEHIAILYTNGDLKHYHPLTENLDTWWTGLSDTYNDVLLMEDYAILAGSNGQEIVYWNSDNNQFERENYTYFDEQFNDIYFDAQANQWWAVANDAALYKHDANSEEWHLQTLQANFDFNQIISQNSQLYVAGSKGLLAKLTLNGTSYGLQHFNLQNLQAVHQGVNKTLRDLAINGDKMYAVGDDGMVVYSSDFLQNNFFKITHSNQHLKSVAAIPGNGHFLTGGNQQVLLDLNGAAKLRRDELYPPELTDVHFANSAFGTVVGNKGFARSTSNGALQWEILLPEELPENDLKHVATFENGQALIASDNGLKFKVVDTYVLVNGTETMTDVRRVGVNNGWAYFVDQNNANADVYQFYTNFQSFNLSQTIAGTVNALQVLDNGSYFLAGNDGLFAYINAAGTPIVENPTDLGNSDFNDMAILDNLTIVLVGNNGAYYHSKDATDDGNGYLASCGWFQQTGIFDGDTDPYNVDANTEVDIRTVAFGTSTDAVLGGKYNSGFTNFSNPQYCYVRTVYDAPERFSARFFYDKLGRLVVSQNARQYNADQVGENAYKKYSYSLYDALGRVIEAGEKTDASTSSATGLSFRSIFGSYVSDIYNPSVIDDAKLQAWIEGAGERREVTKSYYDQTVIAALPSGFSPNPTTQRKRITHVTYEELYDGDDQTYDHATHYDYDIHGNVKTMLQDNRKMKEQFSSLASQQFKRLDYRYDLVSGNVHRMSVQNGEVDQWHHAYRYDADNRIVETYTNSRTPMMAISRPNFDLENELTFNIDWENDAKYFYYAHGPLARTEIGDKKLQGFDYIYNLQGWMKGVNAIETANDPGKDGYGGVDNYFAKDISAFSLEYFNNDYQAINGETPFAIVNSSSHAASNSSALFNGNIRYMQTRLTNPTTGDDMPMLNAYEYDQLNRLIKSRSYENGLSANEWNPVSYGNEYYNAFSYDAMGNILTQKRHTRDGTQIEDMSYQYQYEDPVNKLRLMRNRLYHINDAVLSNVDATDIDDMGLFDSDIEDINISNNYSYDEEGRLTRDNAEGISKIVWRVDGKVKEIQRSNGEAKWLKFDYDAMGHRIAKHIFSNGGVNHERSTYYILDAQGNQISTYDHEVVSEIAQFNLKERNIYGSSRIGSKQDSLNVLSANSGQNNTHILGTKYFEFSNHLGNVLTVFSDNKILFDNDADGEVDEYKVQIVNSADYSPFGVELDGRTIQNDFFRFGFQNQEKDDEIKGEGNSVNYKYRMHDPRVGRFFAVDPLASKYPWNSVYAFSENLLIHMLELEGLESSQLGFGINWYEMFGLPEPPPNVNYDISNQMIVTPQMHEQMVWYSQQGDFGQAGKGLFNGIIDGVIDAALSEISFFQFFDEATVVAKKLPYKSFNKTNFRHNLKIKTKKLNISNKFEAHHKIPQNKNMRKWFKSRGITDKDIHSPQNGVWREKKHHGKKSKEHTKEWKTFQKNNPNATREDILDARDVIDTKVFGNSTGDPIK